VRQPWERMLESGESEAAFQAFIHYRELPPGQRSTAAVAQECRKNRSLITRWSARWSWLQRVAAFDQWVDEQKVSAQVDALAEMWRRQTQIALVGQQQAMQWLQQVDPSQLRDEVGLRLLIETTRLERIARGAQADEEVGGLEPVGPGRSLAELFVVAADPSGPGVSELELARIVVERAQRAREEDLDEDLEVAELVVKGGDPDNDEDGPDDDDPAEELPPAAEVTEPPLTVVPEPPPEQPGDEVSRARRYLREHPRRPEPGQELVTWLQARQVVRLDPPPDWRPPPRRHRRHTL
jgi:hypothetical protein